MEALAGVASGMAVASLSIQLIQSIGTIKTFIQDVKGASKELERLAELLDSLHALLEDIHDVMKRQTSLQDQHFPAPPMTIFNRLKSCETSLQSLHSVIEKYKRGQASNASTVARLKEDIRFGFKTKDITAFEARIQRDIDYLHAALGTNTASILTTMLPLLLRNQQDTLVMYSRSNQQSSSKRLPSNLAVQRDTSPCATNSQMIISRRQYWVPSWLQRLGIRQRKSVRYISVAGKRTRTSNEMTDEIISENYEVFLAWKLLGYGFHWCQQYPYGSIVPSLATFPIVADMRDYDDFIGKAPMQEIQQAFSSRMLHPFTRDIYGISLLHMAAFWRRADVCRLLLEYGLKPELTHGGASPLSSSLLYGAISKSPIDTTRILLLDCDQVDDFQYEMLISVWGIGLNVIEWIWVNAAHVFYGAELLGLRQLLATNLVKRYSYYDLLTEDSITELLVKLMDDEMLKHYLNGDYRLLPNLFEYGTSLKSESVGSAFFNLLARLGLDAEACIVMELEHLPEGYLDFGYSEEPARKVVFEKSQDGGWILRWEWVYDSEDPGYLVVSEYNALSCDTWSPYMWPFSEEIYFSNSEEDLNREARFNRRMAAKGRKERARTGQKRPRSKMPGTWNW